MASKQDVRLEEAIGTAGNLVGLTVAAMIDVEPDTVGKLVKGAILEVLDKLGVDTAGIKTASETAEIHIQE